MPQAMPTMAEQIALAVIAFQQKLTGRKPNAVMVVLSGETLVVTLHGALSPSESSMRTVGERQRTVKCS